MNRLFLILCAIALAFGATPAAAQRFEPTRFTVETIGRGSDVILIPGLTSGREIWRATAGAVPGYRYHLIQVSGFAGEPSRGNRTGPVVAPLADEIARYIADRRLVRPAIVGHSMGGTLAMMVAARRPDLVGRIMVVDMLPQPAGLVGGSARDMAPLADGIGGLLGTTGGRRLFSSFMEAFTPPDATARRSDPEVVGRAMRDLATTDLTGQLPRIRAPFTIVYGSPSREANAAIDRSFARAYAAAPRARLIRIDGSGHMVMLDQPARFRGAMRDFLIR